MKITRNVDGLRFVAECDTERGFLPQEIECATCSARVDPRHHATGIFLGCPTCQTIPQIFWSEAQMHVFIAENWNVLRQLCSGGQFATAQHAS